MRNQRLFVLGLIISAAMNVTAAPTSRPILAPAVRPVVPIPHELDMPDPVPDPAGPMTRERLSRLIVSGSLYRALEAGIANAHAPAATSATTSALSTSGRRLRPQTAAVSLSTDANTTNSTLQDFEPTIAAVNIGGTMHTTSVSTRFDTTSAGSTYHIFAHQTTDLAIYTTTQLYSPINRFTRAAAYNAIADPLMAVNTSAGGVWPHRMYCVALGENLPTPASANSGIHVWHSDDGGVIWSDGASVFVQAGGGFVVDKPAIAVSLQQQLPPGVNESSLGYVYVAYVLANAAGTSNELRVARSTDGGASFTTTQTITTGLLNFPQVVVDNVGAVSVIWFQQTNGVNALWTAQSTDYGLNFSAPATITTANVMINQTIQGMAATRASSIPMARYNPIANRITVAYYGRATAGARAQAYYTYAPCTVGACTNGWLDPVQVNATIPNGEAFNAAIDYHKGNGNVIVSWYNVAPQTVDASGNCTSRNPDNTCLYLYDDFVSYLNADGTRLQNDVRISTTPSNPHYQTPSPGFIGDYQDIWDDNYAGTERAVAARIGIPGGANSNGEAFVTSTTY